MLGNLKDRLSRTRENLAGKIKKLSLTRARIDDDLMDELEEILIKADVGVSTTFKILEGVKKRASKEGTSDASEVARLVKEEMAGILACTNQSPDEEPKSVERQTGTKPEVIFVIGVNGTGKTTSIAKLAKLHIDAGKSVLLAACDTFRAAAADQLSIWADRLGCEIVKTSPGADPAAVAFDAVNAAVSRNKDVVIVDTAGRLHVKANLMEELKKIKRVMGKALPGAPHRTYLVLDATTGQNATRQVEIFREAVGLDGIILAKLDGTAKGGVILAIADQYKVPVSHVGLGETLDDLEPFDIERFLDAVFA